MIEMVKKVFGPYFFITGISQFRLKDRRQTDGLSLPGRLKKRFKKEIKKEKPEKKSKEKSKNRS